MDWLGLRSRRAMTWGRGLGVMASLFVVADCYSTGSGTAPPEKSFYFPVGLAVSSGGSVLYAVNSDFDLQWNGGTLQSYDLHLIRRHALLAIRDPNDPNLPLVRPAVPGVDPCPSNPPIYKTDGSGTRQPLGETCSPPVDSTIYVRDSAIIGAFATDLQLSRTGTRLFSPVRGDASLTWADLAKDDPNATPPDDPKAPYPPYVISCGVRQQNRCAADHHAGNNPSEPGNTRAITMPGEPFGMAQSDDGSLLTITHQNDTKTSLFATGLGGGGQPTPSLQFVLDGLPVGGNGIVAVPHDNDAFGPCAGANPCPGAPRPAFLQTSRATPELDLLRVYSDQGITAAGAPAPSSLTRPFLLREAVFSLTANAGGSDSRGIVIDPTPRLACKANVAGPNPTANPPRTQADVDLDIRACARKPARVFFANRTPATMITGEIGESSGNGDQSYDPDKLVIYGNVPLSFGPSKIYLAPIVDSTGAYALRVFIVCFDSATLFIYDPDTGAVENIVRVANGPFAMAFDPFDLADVAAHKQVEMDTREPGKDLRRYRFAYIASFTNSYVQLLDLDNARGSTTFEKVVYTLGNPTLPKGT